MLEGKNILIATGSQPAKPPIEGLDSPGVVTSDELLTRLEELPESIIIIGGGVIGVEFATFVAAADGQGFGAEHGAKIEEKRHDDCDGCDGFQDYAG